MGIPLRCCAVSDGRTVTGETGEITTLVIPGTSIPAGTRVHITQVWAGLEPAQNKKIHLVIETEGGTKLWEEFTEDEPFISRVFFSPLRGPIGENLVINLDAQSGSTGTISATYFISA